MFFKRLMNAFDYGEFNVKYWILIKTRCEVCVIFIIPSRYYSQVLPGLYVGNYQDSKDPDQLERFEITHILAIHDTARRLHSVSTNDVQQRAINILNFRINSQTQLLGIQ